MATYGMSQLFVSQKLLRLVEFQASGLFDCRWCRADAPDMDGIFIRLLQRAHAGVKWDDKTIKEMVVTCSQVSNYKHW